MRAKMTARIYRQECLANGIYSMELEAPELCREARAGQFVSLFTKDGARLMPRPISICENKKEEGRLRLVYRIAGAGTLAFSKLREGDTLALLGPLGNGFPMEGKQAVIVGGGIGIFPLLQLAKELPCEKTIVLGYRDELFMKDEFEPYGRVYVASENGEHGVKGNVLDAMREYGISGDTLYACGPTPMLAAVKAFAREQGITAYISLEERMACGIGACLGCVCQTKDVDAHSNVNNKRICKDGPVFLAEEVEL